MTAYDWLVAGVWRQYPVAIDWRGVKRGVMPYKRDVIKRNNVCCGMA